MSTSREGFYRALILEHLEEISSLYGLRLAWLENPELSWIDVAELEDRIDAHLDALVVGKEYMFKLYESQLPNADAGELYAYTCFSCRIGYGPGEGQPLLDVILEQVDDEDEDQVNAVIDALRFESSASAVAHLEAQLTEETDTPKAVVVGVVGCRGQHLNGIAHLLTPLLTPLLKALPDRILPIVIRRLVNCRSQGVGKAIESLLNSDNLFVKTAAALGMLKLGKIALFDQLTSPGLEHALAVGLGGTPEQIEQLTISAQSGEINEQVLLALGLYGDVKYIPLLLQYLSHELLGQAAARALFLISGAMLDDTVYVEEKFEASDLFENELDDFKQSGKTPLKADGHVYGEHIKQFSVDPKRWRSWFEASSMDLTEGRRYRFGREYRQEALLEGMRHASATYLDRRCFQLELWARFDVELGFEVDSWVVNSLRVYECH